MTKLRTQILIENEEKKTSYTVSATVKKNTIEYEEKDETKVIFNYDNNILERENKELKMVYSFDLEKQTEGLIEIKELNKRINLVIKTTKIIRNDYNVEIDYQLDNNNFKYKIEVLE